MEFLVLVMVLVLGLALGWMLGLDSGRKSVQEMERAYWLVLVQDLEKEIRLVKAKVKARELGRERENSPKS
jgi:hypothetical protein